MTSDPYAELVSAIKTHQNQMNTHINCMMNLVDSDKNILEFVAENPDAIEQTARLLFLAAITKPYKSLRFASISRKDKMKVVRKISKLIKYDKPAS